MNGSVANGSASTPRKNGYFQPGLEAAYEMISSVTDKNKAPALLNRTQGWTIDPKTELVKSKTSRNSFQIKQNSLNKLHQKYGSKLKASGHLPERDPLQKSTDTETLRPSELLKTDPVYQDVVKLKSHLDPRANEKTRSQKYFAGLSSNQLLGLARSLDHESPNSSLVRNSIENVATMSAPPPELLSTLVKRNNQMWTTSVMKFYSVAKKEDLVKLKRAEIEKNNLILDQIKKQKVVYKISDTPARHLGSPREANKTARLYSQQNQLELFKIPGDSQNYKSLSRTQSFQRIQNLNPDKSRASQNQDPGEAVASDRRKPAIGAFSSRGKPTFLDVFYNKIGIAPSTWTPYNTENTTNSVHGKGQTYLRTLGLTKN